MGEATIAARVRAIRAFSGLDLARFASTIGISRRTLERIETGQRDLTVGEAKLIAAHTHTPEAFLWRGWDSIEAGVISAQLQELLEINRQLQRWIEEMVGQVAATAAAVTLPSAQESRPSAAPRRRQRP